MNTLFAVKIEMRCAVLILLFFWTQLSIAAGKDGIESFVADKS